ncbi:hypothetical protein K2F40_08895 [Clostridium sp. CM028]|uniref:hypothetical protein n=1 Tax=unclassified Clostridium TaxID=2614128 RepID=UPI001C6EA16B|nr:MULTISPECIES: hypothetical protein [unclassified Clostridium]MBW9146636.1 hypothetical protein [Clostridium sp. CM027]MBW9149075.1 hypothetical protein [Clostridium sp. CM028]UVE42044.1 hypothetical protein KTC92_06200 [Clostridium sp. CM027]WLC62659.1 hypothetical protein KTC94_05155 [Clostridium sp. CM028]
MSMKSTIYDVTITEEGLEDYKADTISAKDMAENLGIDAVMTDFQWDEGIERGLILTARIIDDISVEDALSELKNVDYIDHVEES